MFFLLQIFYYISFANKCILFRPVLQTLMKWLRNSPWTFALTCIQSISPSSVQRETASQLWWEEVREDKCLSKKKKRYPVRTCWIMRLGMSDLEDLVFIWIHNLLGERKVIQRKITQRELELKEIYGSHYLRTLARKYKMGSILPQ